MRAVRIPLFVLLAVLFFILVAVIALIQNKLTTSKEVAA
jgi:hypothetical protein